MARRPAFWRRVQASKSEMLLAVDLWNRRDADTNTSAFVVHGQLAWLYLCQARFERDGVDYWIRQHGRRVRGPDGDFRTQPLRWCIAEALPRDSDPVRENVEFFILIRNRIEHRWARDVASVITGKVQAFIMNYERMLSEWFGESLADDLRFPIILSSLSDDAVEAMARVWERLPRDVASFIRSYDDSRDESVAQSQRYEFNVYLIPRVGPRTAGAVTMEFLRDDELTDEQRDELSRAITLIREKQVPVRHLGQLRPTEVAERVAEALDCWFRVTPHHSSAWRHYGVRPAPGDAHPERTDERYCVYDEPHGDWVYTDAWVRKLVRELKDPVKFHEVTGQPQLAL